MPFDDLEGTQRFIGVLLRRSRRVLGVVVGGMVLGATLAEGNAHATTTTKAKVTRKKTSVTTKTSAATVSSKKSTKKKTTADATVGDTKAPTKTTAKASSVTTIDVRPVSETSTTKPKSAGSSTSTPSVKTVSGRVFIPGAGRVLDLAASEVAKLASRTRIEDAVSVDVRGASGLAASGAGSVILDVTVSNPTAAGRVTLSPVAPEYARAAVQSSLGFQSGATTVTRIAVPVGAGGLVKVGTTAGPTGLSVSVVGWVITAPAGTAEPSAVPMEVCKILDTSTGLGGLQGEVGPTKPFDIPAVGIAKVPPALAANGPSPIAVILSVSGSQATGTVELRVVPSGAESPEMKLFLAAGQTTTANFVVPVGADARAAFYVTGASTQIGVDVVGWMDRDGNVKSAGPC